MDASLGPGTTARNQLERDVKRNRTKLERELRQRRTRVERSLKIAIPVTCIIMRNCPAV